MLNKEKHQLVMTQILKDISSDVMLVSQIAFKGGTAMMFLYGLPRFSVDLDFDLLEDTRDNRDAVYNKVRHILQQYGEIKDEQQKLSTIFFALSYGVGDYQIKVEINTRPTGASYEIQNYLGIPLLVATKESLFAGKLLALTQRKRFVARDLYDTYFFLKQGWDINAEMLAVYGVGTAREYFAECALFVENVAPNTLLAGLGELLTDKEKIFVKNKLQEETLFLLRARAV
jgi:predicted nucleotidyltransferase component of viral defense system